VENRDQLLNWLGQQLVPGRLAADVLEMLGQIELWNFEDEVTNDDRLRKIEDLVGRAYEAAVSVRYAAPLLTLYLRFECERAWEVSWWHDPIRCTIRSATTAWRALEGMAAPTDASMMPGLLRCLEILDHELTVEAAAATASTAMTAEWAAKTAGVADETHREAESTLAQFCDDAVGHSLMKFVSDCGKREKLYYDAVATAAGAASDYFTSAPNRLRGAIGSLRSAETNDLIDEIDRSELRAHRASLESIDNARERAWLQVDHGDLIYLYPFGLRGTERLIPPETFVKKLREKAHNWVLEDLPVRRVEKEVPLNDFWHGDDPHQRRYRTAAAVLPNLLIPDPDGGRPVELSFELRLSHLGNHYLRLRTEIKEATPPQLFAAMLRPAPENGDLAELGLQIRTEDEVAVRWGSLADLSTAVIDALTGQLEIELGSKIENSGRPGMYHVLVSIDRASSRGRDDTSSTIENGSDLEQAFGIQPVWHPIRHGVSAIGEWARYPLDHSLIVPSPAFTGDLLVRTPNSTLLGTFGSPSYMTEAVVEAAEFVATLEGMFATWQQELADYYGFVDNKLKDLEHDKRSLLSELETRQLQLHQFIMTSRRTLEFITSPSLVTSPVMRLTLDKLLDAATYNRLRSEFEEMVEQVLGDRVGALLDAAVRRHQEDRDLAEQKRHLDEQENQRIQRRRTDVLLAAIAGAGTAGVFQLIHAGFEQHMPYAISFAAAAILIAITIAIVVYHLTSKSESGADEPDRTVR
jgi:hypothetical protein